MSNKKYEIQIHDIQFTKIDEDGNEMLNDDGSTRIFTTKNSANDILYGVAESMEDEYLIDWHYEIVPKESKQDKYSADEMVDFIHEHNIGHHSTGMMGNGEIIVYDTENDAILCKYPWEDSNVMIEAVAFLMDMHYQKLAEEKANANVR
jgi:hypothetical protein